MTHAKTDSPESFLWAFEGVCSAAFLALMCFGLVFALDAGASIENSPVKALVSEVRPVPGGAIAKVGTGTEVFVPNDDLDKVKPGGTVLLVRRVGVLTGTTYGGRIE
jgi:hypothetical protein